MSKVFILTLSLNPELQNELNLWRARYFPPERNFLDAHVTLFHALPEIEWARFNADVEQVTRKTPRFKVRVAEPYSLGRGVGVKVEAKDIGVIHQRLQNLWQDFLRPQDLQKRRAHCTLQNKVEPAHARASRAEIGAAWTNLEGEARALDLWEYLNGPWRFCARYDLRVSRGD